MLCDIRNLALAALMVLVFPARAQPAGDATPQRPAIKFDIVSFKPCKDAPGPTAVVMPMGGDSIGYRCQPVWRLIYFAYAGGPQPFHLTGEPTWVDDDRYDFQAKVAPTDVAEWLKMDLVEKRMMMRNFLSEQLHLTLHADTTARSVYLLEIAKNGPKFSEYKDGDATTLPDGRTITGRTLARLPDGSALYQGVPMADIAQAAAYRVGRQVIDRTGLTGLYTVTLVIPQAHYDASHPTDAGDAAIPALFDSLRTAGLQLQSGKAPTGGLIFDHIDKPAVN